MPSRRRPNGATWRGRRGAAGAGSSTEGGTKRAADRPLYWEAHMHRSALALLLGGMATLVACGDAQTADRAALASRVRRASDHGWVQHRPPPGFTYRGLTPSCSNGRVDETNRLGDP